MRFNLCRVALAPRKKKGHCFWALMLCITIAQFLAAYTVAAEQGGCGVVDQWMQKLPKPINGHIPSKPIDDPGFPGSSQSPRMNIFPWQEFIALNWPADVSQGKRGVADKPDDPEQFGRDAGEKTPRMWETWKQEWELFQPANISPSDWDAYDVAFPICNRIVEKDGTEVAVNKVNWVALYQKYGRTVLNEINQASAPNPTGPLIDQNGKYVRYEIRVNETEYEFIKNKGYYLRKNLPRSVNLPCTSDPAKPCPDDTETHPPDSKSPGDASGAMELKAAWREYDPDKDAPELYYSKDVLVLEHGPEGRDNICYVKAMLLVGFHILHKVETMPGSHFVWASFEHVDNAPYVADNNGNKEEKRYSFNNGNEPTPEEKKKGYDYQPQPIAYPSNPPQLAPKPVQVFRVRDIDPVTQCANQAFHEHIKGIASDSVWRNYVNVMTQWPVPGLAGPFSAYNRANVTLETYRQNVFCEKCHRNAGTDPQTRNKDISTDFSWILYLKAWPPRLRESDL